LSVRRTKPAAPWEFRVGTALHLLVLRITFMIGELRKADWGTV